jgi:glyoxylate/hydroxypyruvate reductase A
MIEWVTLQVLMHHRGQRRYDRAQAAHRWQVIAQPTAREVRVGIMGMGVLGRAVADALAHLGYDVAGWSTTRHDLPGVRSFAGSKELASFLGRTDILVALLPLTPQTKGALSMPLFRRLARDGKIAAPVLINAGRGGLQVESDILAALDAGILGGASLDVFEKEPLDPASPLWDRPDVVITPHASANSYPAALAPGIVSQIAAFERGEPLRNVVDRARGY